MVIYKNGSSFSLEGEVWDEGDIKPELFHVLYLKKIGDGDSVE